MEILDTSRDTTGLRVYPSRLAGVSLEERDVRFYSTNAQGEIDRLVLRDVTGDMHTYGLMTGMEEISAGMTAMGTYTVDVNGTETTITSSSTPSPLVKAGPCVIKGSLMAPDQMLNLTEVRLDSVSGNSAAVGSQTYPISEHVSVYEYRNGHYYVSSLSRVSGGAYTLNGYYDHPVKDGGQMALFWPDNLFPNSIARNDQGRRMAAPPILF